MNTKTIFRNLVMTLAGSWDANFTSAIASAADFLITFRSKNANAILVAESPIEWFSLLFQPDLVLCRVSA